MEETSGELQADELLAAGFDVDLAWLARRLRQERTKWSREYQSSETFRNLIDRYDAGYQTLRQAIAEGRLAEVQIRERANGLATLLARAYGLADEDGWLGKTVAGMLRAGHAYVEPSVFGNDLTGALAMTRATLGLAFELATMFSPAHAAAFRAARFGVNLSYVLGQCYVSCCASTLGSGTAQPGAVIKQAHEGVEFQPSQVSTSYKGAKGEDIAPPVLREAKQEWKLTMSVWEWTRGKPDTDHLQALRPVIRKVAMRLARLQSTCKRLGDQAKLSGPESLHLARLESHRPLLLALVQLLQAYEAACLALNRSSQRALREAELLVSGHKGRIEAKLALARDFLQLNVQREMGRGKALRAVTNMLVAGGSGVKAIYQLATDDVDGFDGWVFGLDLLGLSGNAAQWKCFRLTQGPGASKDFRGKVVAQLSITAQTELGNLRRAGEAAIDVDKLNDLFSGPMKVRIGTYLKAAKYDGNVYLSSLIGHLIDRRLTPRSVAPVDRQGKPVGRPIELSFQSLFKEFNRLLKANGDLRGFARHILNITGATTETRIAVDANLDLAQRNTQVLDLVVGEDLIGLLSSDGPLTPQAREMLRQSLAYAQWRHGPEGDPCPKECERGEGLLIRKGGSADKRTNTESIGQCVHKFGGTFDGFLFGNGSAYAIKVLATAGAEVLVAAGGFEPGHLADAADAVQLSGASLTVLTSLIAIGVSYMAARHIKEKNDQRARNSASGEAPVPNAGVQKNGEHDFAILLNWDRITGTMSDFTTLVGPPIAPEHQPLPYHYETSIDFVKDALAQMLTTELFSRKVVKRWLAAIDEMPSRLHENPAAVMEKLARDAEKLGQQLHRLTRSWTPDEKSDESHDGVLLDDGAEESTQWSQPPTATTGHPMNSVFLRQFDRASDSDEDAFGLDHSEEAFNAASEEALVEVVVEGGANNDPGRADIVIDIPEGLGRLNEERLNG